MGVRPADVAFVSAAGGVGSHPAVGRGTERVQVHSFDYDAYLRAKAAANNVDHHLAVFLDQNIPFHPDWTNAEDAPFASAQEYYPQLCRFFDRVERETDVRVTIAAHPRSDYGAQAAYFGGRPTIRGETAALVGRARFVIAESSQSAGFAVLFRKPMVMMTRDAYESTTGPEGIQYREQIHLLSRVLGTTLVNISRSEPVDWGRALTVDLAAYQQYQDRYIKVPGSPEDEYWNIVANYIRSDRARGERNQAGDPW
jgi:hypothetical protein